MSKSEMKGLFPGSVQDTDSGSEKVVPAEYIVERTWKKFLLGLLIVFIIACSWVGSTQTGKSAYSNNFKAPFFSMWFGTAWMMSLFPLSAPFYFLTQKRSIKDLLNHSKQVFSPDGLTVKDVLSSTVLFGIIWGATNYMYSRALMTMSATDVTALFSSAPAFVFLFSMCILKEKLLILRLGSVVLVVSGITLFAYADGFQPSNIIGVILSVGSAIGAATYKVLLKWRVRNATIYQMTLFLSSLGLFSTLLLWPIALILHVLKVEEITNVPWLYLCASSALSVVFNLSINFGIAYTFPLFISIGTLLGIPLNAVVDQVLRNVTILNWKFPATEFIIAGFILMLLPPSDSQFIQNKIWKGVRRTT